MRTVLPLVREKFQPDVVIANGENSAGGLGIIRRTADELFEAGVNVLTGGNHIWDKKEALDLLKTRKAHPQAAEFPRLDPGQRLHGLPDRRPGTRWWSSACRGGCSWSRWWTIPSSAIDEFLKKNTHPIVLVDFHAEATAEKQAMGFFLDGRVSALLGTHTHVPTADARVLENGTAYQTDVGMTGSLDSVIGMTREPIISKFYNGMHQKFEVAQGNQVLDMTVVDVDPKSGRAAAHRSPPLLRGDLWAAAFLS